MKTMNKLPVFGTVLACILTVNCSKEQPFQSYNSPHEIQPLLKLSRNLSIDEIASAEAVVSGGGIRDSLSFTLAVDRVSSKLKGILRIPEGVNSCELAVYIYDSLNRKMGQGSYTLTPNDFETGMCATPEIGIESAKPRIDTLYTNKQAISIGDTIYLYATASDRFGGKIETYEWKFGSNDWITASHADTFTTVSSSNYQTFACSLRVTDDEGNTTTRAVSVTIVGIVTDVDGNKYHTVKLGKQVWTVENLATTKYSDGTAIPYGLGNSATAVYCYYLNYAPNLNRT